MNARPIRTTHHDLRKTPTDVDQPSPISPVAALSHKTDEARLLLDHTVQGIDGVYIHEKALFDRLLATQEKMSAAILGLLDR